MLRSFHAVIFDLDGVLADSLVGLQCEPELASSCRHVRSDVRKVRRPIRSMRMITRSSGSGQATWASCASQSPSGSSRCLAARNGNTDWSA